jgi:hypothetical protein
MQCFNEVVKYCLLDVLRRMLASIVRTRTAFGLSCDGRNGSLVLHVQNICECL